MRGVVVRVWFGIWLGGITGDVVELVEKLGGAIL